MAVAAATVLSGTALSSTVLSGTALGSTAPGGTSLTGTGRASTVRAAAGLGGTGRASTGPAGPAGVQPVPLGGAQLAGRGVVVNYPARGARPLPKVKASAYVVADAGTGQVLAAKDPHGLYRPASTLKVLTAIALMPVLNPDATV
ncbi:MAG TPA: hypothetical protein VH642_02840, partial [Streptosporangiaceae bacterium]